MFPVHSCALGPCCAQAGSLRPRQTSSVGDQRYANGRWLYTGQIAAEAQRGLGAARAFSIENVDNASRGHAQRAQMRWPKGCAHAAHAQEAAGVRDSASPPQDAARRPWPAQVSSSSAASASGRMRPGKPGRGQISIGQKVRRRPWSAGPPKPCRSARSGSPAVSSPPGSHARGRRAGARSPAWRP